jgi:flavin-binding protein dodecin
MLAASSDREVLPTGGSTRRCSVSVARVTEISVQSQSSFEDAIQEGIQRASQTLRNVTSAWVKEQKVLVENGKISGWEVHLLVTFILDEGTSAGS